MNDSEREAAITAAVISWARDAFDSTLDGSPLEVHSREAWCELVAGDLFRVDHLRYTAYWRASVAVRAMFDPLMRLATRLAYAELAAARGVDVGELVDVDRSVMYERAVEIARAELEQSG